jgi:hypothetical protein
MSLSPSNVSKYRCASVLAWRAVNRARLPAHARAHPRTRASLEMYDRQAQGATLHRHAQPGCGLRDDQGGPVAFELTRHDLFEAEC